jgi:hypothetical protein
VLLSSLPAKRAVREGHRSPSGTVHKLHLIGSMSTTDFTSWPVGAFNSAGVLKPPVTTAHAYIDGFPFCCLVVL